MPVPVMLIRRSLRCLGLGLGFGLWLWLGLGLGLWLGGGTHACTSDIDPNKPSVIDVDSCSHD